MHVQSFEKFYRRAISREAAQVQMYRLSLYREIVKILTISDLDLQTRLFHLAIESQSKSENT